MFACTKRVYFRKKEPPMRKITALELQRHPGRAQDLAIRGPIAITHRGRPRVVLLAFEEYERLIVAAVGP